LAGNERKMRIAVIGRGNVGGSGIRPSMLRTTARSDGHPEVTYNGHPLYFFRGDKMPGDTNGQGVNAFGGGWFALSPAGDQVSGQASNSGSNNGYSTEPAAAVQR
jgi:secreted repeat protein with Y-X4-D motif